MQIRQRFDGFPSVGASKLAVPWVIGAVETVSRKEPAMNLQNSRYDPELQMFTDPPREPDPARLRFLRWLSELRRLEHEPVGVPTGRYADREAVRR
jgi:hypothetical protein